MLKRIWDPENKYECGFLKEYKYWAVELSFRQHTLGCFIIFSKRKIEKISDLENEEMIELKSVIKKVESAFSNIDIFKPDRFNYLQLGNALHHLHFHGIPRYSSARNFNGKIWVDNAFGHPPAWSKEEVDKNLIKKIKELLLFELEK